MNERNDFQNSLFYVIKWNDFYFKRVDIIRGRFWLNFEHLTNIKLLVTNILVPLQK